MRTVPQAHARLEALLTVQRQCGQTADALKRCTPNPARDATIDAAEHLVATALAEISRRARVAEAMRPLARQG